MYSIISISTRSNVGRRNVVLSVYFLRLHVEITESCSMNFDVERKVPGYVLSRN